MQKTTITQFTESDGTVIYVETPKPASPHVEAGGSDDVIEKAKDSFQDAVEKMKPVIGKVYNQLKSTEINADEVEVKMAFKVTGECGLVLSTVGGEASFKVTLKWNNQNKKE